MKYAFIRAGLVAEIILPSITDEDILTPDGDGVLQVVVRAGEQVPLALLYSPAFCEACVLVPEGVDVAVGDSYVDGAFGPAPARPVPAPLTAAEVLAQRDALLALATLRIDPLADAVELGDATPAEVAALKAWREYRVALNRIPQQTGYPSKVNWPKAPA